MFTLVFSLSVTSLLRRVVNTHGRFGLPNPQNYQPSYAYGYNFSLFLLISVWIQPQSHTNGISYGQDVLPLVFSHKMIFFLSSLNKARDPSSSCDCNKLSVIFTCYHVALIVTISRSRFESPPGGRLRELRIPSLPLGKCGVLLP